MHGNPLNRGMLCNVTNLQFPCNCNQPLNVFSCFLSKNRISHLFNFESGFIQGIFYVFMLK